MPEEVELLKYKHERVQGRKRIYAEVLLDEEYYQYIINQYDEGKQVNMRLLLGIEGRRKDYRAHVFRERI